MTKNFMYIDETPYSATAEIAIVDEVGVVSRIHTAHLIRDRNVHAYRGDQRHQLCAGATFSGWTLYYDGPELFAKACNARLYKTRAGFERAIRRVGETAAL